MLIYKIDQQVRNLNFNESNYSSTTNELNKMMGLVMADYKYYYRAPSNIQNRYDFSLQAIYSCLSKVNNDDNRIAAYKELSNFLIEIKNKTGMNMQIINKNNILSVKERPKIKIKRYYERLNY